MKKYLLGVLTGLALAFGSLFAYAYWLSRPLH